MLLTEVYPPANIFLQSLPDTTALKGADKAIQQSVFFKNPESEPRVKIQTALALIEIFKIKFNYLTKIHHTKAMKVKYGSDNALYKVVLFSILSPVRQFVGLNIYPKAGKIFWETTLKKV